VSAKSVRRISTILVLFRFERERFDFYPATFDPSPQTTCPRIAMTLADLARQSCQPRKGAGHALGDAEVTRYLAVLPGWSRTADGKGIAKDFRFDDFHRTLGFINAVGFMANRQDHHPDLEAGYGHCQVAWSTHDVGGLSLNDMVCAARVEQLLT
jgi:4a-hydroxytetrahydrobiopterin dehydratase